MDNWSSLESFFNALSNFLKGLFSFLNQAEKAVDAASIQTEIYCGKEKAGQAAGIIVKNTGNYPAKGLTAKMTVMEDNSYPFGPDPFQLKWGNRQTIDLGGQGKDYLLLCVAKGNRLAIPANNGTLDKGSYVFETDIFGNNVGSRKISVKIRWDRKKLRAKEI